MKTTRASIARSVALAAVLATGVAGCSGNSTTTTNTTSAATTTSATSTTAAGTSATTEAATTTSATTETSTDSATSEAGGDAGQAQQILSKALANAKAAKSGSVNGTIDNNGEQMTIALKGTADGKSTDAKVTMGKQGTVHIIVVNGKTFMQADATFAKSQGGGAFPAGKWLKVPASMAGNMTDQFTFGSLMKQMTGDITPSDVAADVAEETVEGKDCYVLTDSTAKSSTKAYVDKASGNIVRISGLDGKNGGSITFSQWNEQIDIAEPQGAISLG